MAAGVLDGAYSVLTPEYVEFEFSLAGLYSRFLAWLLDSLVTAVLAAGMFIALALLSVVIRGFGIGMAFVGWFLLDWGYYILLETAWAGQTVGKRALGIRVIQETGVRAGFLSIALRNLVRPLDRLPLFYLVGAVAALCSEHHQRLGDTVGGTVVVRERRQRLPSGLSGADVPQVPLDPVVAKLPDRIGAEERDLLVAAALRREELAMDARLHLFSTIGEWLEREHGVKRPAHMSPEKWVLALTAVIVKPKPRRIRHGR